MLDTTIANRYILYILINHNNNVLCIRLNVKLVYLRGSLIFLLKYNYYLYIVLLNLYGIMRKDKSPHEEKK